MSSVDHVAGLSGLLDPLRRSHIVAVDINLYSLPDVGVPCEVLRYNLQCRSLLSRLDGCGLWLNSLLFDVSTLSLCGILRSGLSGSQMKSLCGTTGCYIADQPAASETDFGNVHL